MTNMVRHGSDVHFFSSSHGEKMLALHGFPIFVGLLKYHFCGGLITVNIYLGNFEGISLTIVHCFTKKNQVT